jgi:hypothetical protein
MTKRWLSPEDAARIGEQNRKAWAAVGPSILGRPATGGEVTRSPARPRSPEFRIPSYVDPRFTVSEAYLLAQGPPLDAVVPSPPMSEVLDRLHRGKAGARLPVPTETSECLAFISWTHMVLFRGRPLFDRVVKIPNERGKAGASTAILASIGMRTGFPDYGILAPTRLWSGLFLEAKRIRGSKISADQEVWRDDLREFGYCARICAGADELIAATREYFVTSGCDRDGTWIDRTKGKR